MLQISGMPQYLEMPGSGQVQHWQGMQQPIAVPGQQHQQYQRHQLYHQPTPPGAYSYHGMPMAYNAQQGVGAMMQTLQLGGDTDPRAWQGMQQPRQHLDMHVGVQPQHHFGVAPRAIIQSSLLNSAPLVRLAGSPTRPVGLLGPHGVGCVQRPLGSPANVSLVCGTVAPTPQNVSTGLRQPEAPENERGGKRRQSAADK